MTVKNIGLKNYRHIFLDTTSLKVVMVVTHIAGLMNRTEEL